jgi:hypothetical protein
MTISNIYQHVEFADAQMSTGFQDEWQNIPSRSVPLQVYVQYQVESIAVEVR